MPELLLDFCVSYLTSQQLYRSDYYLPCPKMKIQHREARYRHIPCNNRSLRHEPTSHFITLWTSECAYTNQDGQESVGGTVRRAPYLWLTVHQHVITCHTTVTGSTSPRPTSGFLPLLQAQVMTSQLPAPRTCPSSLTSTSSLFELYERK